LIALISPGQLHLHRQKLQLSLPIYLRFGIFFGAIEILGRDRLPFSHSMERGSALILSAEDDAARVLKPRLLANGADVKRIRFDQSLFTLDERGIELLRIELEQHRPILVVIDTLYAYMDDKSDINHSGDATKFLGQLDRLAREYNCAILLIRHFRKAATDDPIYRGLGSIAISARVRSGLMLGMHPNSPDPDLRVLVHSKSNYAKKGPAILFRIVDKGVNRPPVLEWAGIDPDLTAEDLLSSPQRKVGRPSDEREQAIEFLRQYLATGKQPKRAIVTAAEASAISEMTLRRAADQLGVKKFKLAGASYWKLATVNSNEKPKQQSAAQNPGRM
jgi:hypothetical protein